MTIALWRELIAPFTFLIGLLALATLVGDFLLYRLDLAWIGRQPIRCINKFPVIVANAMRRINGSLQHSITPSISYWMAITAHHAPPAMRATTAGNILATAAISTLPKIFAANIAKKELVISKIASGATAVPMSTTASMTWVETSGSATID